MSISKAQIERVASLHLDKISSMQNEAKLFGLISDRVDSQKVRSISKRLSAMFRKGQHTVKSYLDRTNTIKHIEVSALDSTASIVGLLVDPNGGYTYKTLMVNIDGRSVKVSDLDEAVKVIYNHFKAKGLH